MKEVYIVKAEIDCGRENVEAIEGCHYETLDDFFNEEEVKEMQSRGYVSAIPLYEFTTDWNDTDDEGDYLEVSDFWIAYIFIG